MDSESIKEYKFQIKDIEGFEKYMNLNKYGVILISYREPRNYLIIEQADTLNKTSANLFLNKEGNSLLKNINGKNSTSLIEIINRFQYM